MINLNKDVNFLENGGVYYLLEITFLNYDVFSVIVDKLYNYYFYYQIISE